MNLNNPARILLFSRIFIGLVFLLSGIGKLIDRSDAIYLVEMLSTQVYWLIEYRNLIALSLTVAELILAVFLLVGKFKYPALFISFVFIFGLSSVLLYLTFQGFIIESCGCFGVLDLFTGLPATLAKNVVLLCIIALGIWSFRKVKRLETSSAT